MAEVRSQKERIYQSNMKQNVEIKSFPSVESPHLSRWSGRREKSVTWKFLFWSANEWWHDINQRKTEKKRRSGLLSEYHQLLRGHMRDRGKSWSHSSAVLKEAGDYPWRLKTLLSSTVIPSHKSVLIQPLFIDKAAEHSLVQRRKWVTSSSLASLTLSSSFCLQRASISDCWGFHTFQFLAAGPL